METIVTLGSLSMTRFGAMSALAMLVLLCAACLWCCRKGIGYAAFIRTAVLAVPMAWLMGRVVYVIACYNYYLFDLEYPLFALNFWDGGYAVCGVWLGLVLAGLISERLQRLPRGSMLDALAIGMPLALVIERLAERGTGVGEGRYVETDVPAWMTFINDYGDACYAVFLFEAIVAAVLFVVLLTWTMRCKTRRHGDVLLMFTLLFGCTQVLLESLRDDGHMEVHMGVHVQQVLAALFIVLVLGIWTARALREGRIRRSGAVIAWVIALTAVVLAVVAEFGVDRWDSKVLAYGIMSTCLVVLLVLSVWMRRRCASAEKGV